MDLIVFMDQHVPLRDNLAPWNFRMGGAEIFAQTARGLADDFNTSFHGKPELGIRRKAFGRATFSEFQNCLSRVPHIP